MLKYTHEICEIFIIVRNNYCCRMCWSAMFWTFRITILALSKNFSSNHLEEYGVLARYLRGID